MGTKQKTLITTVILVVAGASTFLYWNGHKSNSKVISNTPNSKNDVVSTEPSTTQSGVSVTTTQSSDIKNTTSSDSSAELKMPYGAFVSNHHPNLGGSPAPNSMNSTCNTTVGATCEIHFTKDAQVKILGPNQVGSNGYVSWDWNLQDLGISEGSWQVEAIATLNEKTLSSKDTMPLEVKP